MMLDTFFCCSFIIMNFYVNYNKFSALFLFQQISCFFFRLYELKMLDFLSSISFCNNPARCESLTGNKKIRELRILTFFSGTLNARILVPLITSP